MKKHKDAIKKIRSDLKLLIEEKPKLRAEILALKFDLEGKRRPETGPKRAQLKQAYVSGTRPVIRASLLACGLLRGVPYRVMEPKTDEPVEYVTWRVHAIIQEAFGEDSALKAEWPKERVRRLILDGIDTTASEAA